jgi:hypothetical protein
MAKREPMKSEEIEEKMERVLPREATDDLDGRLAI